MVSGTTALLGVQMFGKQALMLVGVIIMLIALGIAFLFLGAIAIVAIALIMIGLLLVYQKRVKIGGILAFVGIVLLILTSIGVF